MLAPQRHQLIVEHVRTEGSARVRTLAERLDVSEMTIRRDLDLLAEQRLIDKVHGGATRVIDNSSYEPGFDAKQERQRSEKDLIARRAIDFIPANSSIGLTAGTTTWTLAQRLGATDNLTVVTNAPSIAQTLYGTTSTIGSIVLTGGVRTRSDALVGPIATRALDQMHIDVLFLGVHGMDVEHGFSTPNLDEAEVNRAFVAAARRVVVLADHTKWGTRGLAQIAPLTVADHVISDHLLPPDAVDALSEHGIEVTLVGDRHDTVQTA